jgi:hypothetical protein
MVELDLEDIAQRLRALQEYSPVLAERTENETHLPAGRTAEILADVIEDAVERCGQAAMTGEMGDEMVKLGQILDTTYRYYLARLAAAGMSWSFKFPEPVQCTHKAVHAWQ